MELVFILMTVTYENLFFPLSQISEMQTTLIISCPLASFSIFLKKYKLLFEKVVLYTISYANMNICIRNQYAPKWKKKNFDPYRKVDRLWKSLPWKKKIKRKMKSQQNSTTTDESTMHISLLQPAVVDWLHLKRKRKRRLLNE